MRADDVLAKGARRVAFTGGIANSIEILINRS